MDVNDMIAVRTILGTEVVTLRIDSEGNELIKTELKDRIEKINRNVEKLGSIDNLKNVSKASNKYVMNTRNLIRFFMYAGATEDRVLDDSQHKLAASMLNDTVSRDSLDNLIVSGWEAVLRKYEEYKTSFSQAIC